MSSAPPSVDSTLGAVFIGFAVACGVYGILASQIFNYFWHYPSDHAFVKVIVIAIFLLETADQIFIGHLVYFYSISNYANTQTLLHAATTWSFILQLTVGAIVGAIVKTSFGARVWRFSEHNYYVTGLIMLLTFTQLGLAIAFTVKAFQLPSVFAVHTIQTLGTVSLATGVCTDVVIALALCYYLNRLRTGYPTADSLVNSLCRYAINTGALTSAVSITAAVLFNVNSRNNLHFAATYFILSKLYAISYMATLNTRRMVQGRGTDKQDATTNNTNLFHLGTRVSSKPLSPTAGQDSGEDYYSENNFPYNTFAQPTLKLKTFP